MLPVYLWRLHSELSSEVFSHGYCNNTNEESHWDRGSFRNAPKHEYMRKNLLIFEVVYNTCYILDATRSSCSSYDCH
jgi:hypothetical protein